MITPGRPTQRVLRDDLSEDWDDAGDRAAAAAELMDIGKPLYKLEHQVVRKAKHDFSVEDSLSVDIRREGITDLSDPMWWKLKVGRWRGAVYQDENGQAWLCAAGYRRGKESTDFYQSFMSEVAARGADFFLPTPEDRARLSDELAEAEFKTWEKQLQEDARRTVFEARGSGLESLVISDPAGLQFAEMTVSVTEEEIDASDTVTDIYVEFTCLNYELYSFLEWAETVMCLAIDAREQSWRPTSVKDGRAYSFLLDADEAAEFFRHMERDPLPPGHSVPGREAHWTHRLRLTESTIMGEAVKGLCGQWFVPRQDHASKPACKHCDSIHSRLPSGAPESSR